jgi:mono/diheme cytochrome c family protein
MLTVAAATAAEPPATPPGLAPIDQIKALDVTGKVRRLGQSADCRAVAVMFMATECPIANAYVPELNRLFAAHREAGVEFYGVYSDRSLSWAAAAKHHQEYRVEFPVLFDASGELAAWLKPTHTPNAFVLSPRGEVLYRGRIDDLYADLGKRRAKATQRDFADALAAVCEGKPVAQAETKPIGCLFESPRPGDGETEVTYNRDIAPLLQANCMNCHRDGEIGPFPLTTYGDAKKRAQQLAVVTRSRQMPPWRPEPGFGHFLDERRLTDSEVALFAAWAAGGAPEGDPADLPPAPKFIDGWQLGEPDLIVKVPEAFEIPAEGPDVFRNFVIPLNTTEDKLVAAVEFRPGNRRVVHHSLFYLDASGAARKKDEADPGPGYSTFGGPGFVPSGSIGGWSPGNTPRFLPNQMGRYLKAGSDLVVQIHYHPSGKPETDQSTLGIHFLKRPAGKVVAGLMVLDRGLKIPPGEKRHPMAAAYTLPMDVTIVGIAPHMHLLGREMKATAVLPDGKVEPLNWIKDWNFNWQDEYLFAKPFRLPKGTRLEVEAFYDNSEDNPANPSSPPKLVRWGEQTTDEMFICFFLVSTDKPKDLIPLIIDNLTSIGGRRR